MQNDMATMLLDENGNLKTFNQWMNDVKGIADHQCRRWFQTEYDTAVKRAHLAAQWRQFEREADVLPNLQWVKTMSITPGEDHKPFWHPTPVVRPVKDPFWNLHRPGDRWGCKCSLRATDEPPTPLEQLPQGGNPDMPALGLDNNPGKDGVLFSDTHPYNPPNCSACRLPGKKVLFNNKLRGFFNLAKGRKDCYNCSKPQELIKKAEKLQEKREAFIKARREALDYLNEHFDAQMMSLPNLATGNLSYSKKSLKTLINHAHDIDRIDAAMAIGSHVKDLKFIRVSPFGEGKDLVRDAKNLAKKKDLGIVQFNIYEYHYNAKVYYVKTAQHRDGFEMFYSFTKKP
jgi:hypothetical protein